MKKKNKIILVVSAVVAAACVTCLCAFVVPSFFAKNAPVEQAKNNLPATSNEVYSNPANEAVAQSPEAMAVYLSKCIDVVVKESNEKVAVKKAEAQTNPASPNFANANAEDLYYSIVYDKIENKNTLHISSEAKEDYIGFDSTTVPWYENRFNINKVVIDNQVAPKSLRAWFGCIDYIPTGGIKGSNITSFTNLNYIDFSKLENGDVSFMFTGCNRLNGAALGLAEGSLSNVKNAKAMFAVASFKADDLAGTLADLTNDALTNTSYMYSHCGLTTADVSKIHFDKILNLEGMFIYDKSLTKVDGIPKTTAATNTAYMFCGCENLETINAAEWTNWSTLETLTNSTDMFKGCAKIKGGNGTSYDDKHTDKSYALSDGLDGNPGYFSPRASARKLDNYSLDDLKTISDDISKNGQKSQYWNEFDGYIKNDEIWYGSKGKYDPETKEVTENMKQYCCKFIIRDDGTVDESNINNYLFLRVIGMNHDYKAGSITERAGLTFQVVHSLPQAYTIGTGDNQGWGTEGEGMLRTKMQDGGEIYTKLNPAFTSNIISVDKYSESVRSDTTGEKITATQDKMFVPSYSEMWQTNGSQMTYYRSWYGNGRYQDGRQAFDPQTHKTEGYCYEWHWNKKIDGWYSNEALKDAYKCNNGEHPTYLTTACNWMRSVNCNEPDCFLCLNSYGSYDNNSYKNFYAVRPCFCLGTKPEPITYKYNLETDGNGAWYLDGETSPVTSFETTNPTIPDAKQAINFTGTDGVLHTVSATPNEGHVFSICSFANDTYTASFKKGQAVNYAVCIYQIDGEDNQGPQTITFGPATGKDYDTAIGKATQITDDWATIKANAQAGIAHQKYDAALKDGHIKVITLGINDTLYSGTDPKKTCSSLYDTIKSDYINWNDSYSISDSESVNYATSRIRATLNGCDNMGDYGPSIYAGSCLDSKNCLLNCFPEELQNVIKTRTFDVPKKWNTSFPFTIPGDGWAKNVSDKLWPANATEIWGFSTTDNEFGDYGMQFAKKLSEGTIPSSYNNNIVYNESGFANNWWLRSPTRHLLGFATIGYFDGHFYSKVVSLNDDIALAPCFCL